MTTTLSVWTPGISGPVPHRGGDLPNVLAEGTTQHQASGKQTFGEKATESQVKSYVVTVISLRGLHRPPITPHSLTPLEGRNLEKQHRREMLLARRARDKKERAVLTQPPALHDCWGGEAALCPTPTMGEVVGEVVVVVKQDFRDRGWLRPPPLVGLSPHRGI